MAKRRANKRDERLTLDRDAYWRDDATGAVDRAVRDEEAGQKLDAIVSALGGATTSTTKHVYNETTSVAKDTETTILTLTAQPSVSTYIQSIETSGTNIAEYTVKLNGSVISKKRTMHGNGLNLNFKFDGSSNNGYKLIPGDIVTVNVTHKRPDLGDFNATIQVIEI